MKTSPAGRYYSRSQSLVKKCDTLSSKRVWDADDFTDPMETVSKAKAMNLPYSVYHRLEMIMSFELRSVEAGKILR